MKVKKSTLLRIIKEELEVFAKESSLKEEDDENGSFEDWTDSQAKQTYNSMGGSFEDVVSKASSFAEDPHGFAAALHKRATGKWPTEK